MNKIYKVIWSKVKHQYVVVSELAHSSGKQSRTSRNSIRSRIAALVVCGAIAAFGVYGALPVQQAFAADDKVQQATQTQYVAFKANRNSDEWQQRYQKIYSESDKIWITFRPQTVTLSDGRELYYWVREGYTLEPQENVQYIPDRLMDTQWTDGIKPNFTMSAEITDPEKIKGSVLKTTESNSVGTKATTTRGESLETVEVGHYTGVSNSEGVETGYDWNYIIDPVGNGNQSQYIDIKAAIPEGKNNVWDSGYLKAVEQIGDNYYLAGTNRTVKVDPDNIYIINNKAGVFVTTPNKDSYTEKDIYTGRVYGAHNEILMTSKDDNGQYYTYWAGKVNDDENVLLSDSNLTLGDYRDQIDTFYRNDGKLAAADIKSVELDSKNKSINLITNTKFDENGNLIEGTEETIQGFTVSKTTSQTNGKGNAQIKFSQKDAEGNETSSFVVDAGSIVKANEETSASDETLTSLSVDGTNYKLSQGKTYTKGSGIIVDNTDNTISVDLAKDGDKNISGLHFNATGQLANNLKVTDYVSPTPTENPSQNKDGGNWTITETDGQGLNRELTNTTLDTSASANWNTGTDSLITGAIIAKNNNVENPNEVADATTEYGRNYKVIDTNGNIVELDDVASASKLRDVANNANDAQTEAKKHTIVSTKDENLGVENVGANGAAANYEISLKDKVVLGEGQGAIILNGQNKDEALLNVGNKLVIDQDGTTTIIADDGINNRPGQTQITPDTTVTISPDGVTFAGDDRGTTIIEGQKITAGGIVINGEDIYDETLGTTVKGTIKGLSNTTWNGTTTTPDRAATEGQLQTVSDKADEAVTEAGKHTIVSTKDENLGVENVGANGAAANYEISLKDKVVLGEGQGAIILNGQNKDEALLNVGNKLVIDQDGTTTIIADDGINNRPGQTQITPDTTVTISPDGVTFAGDDRGTTIIEGQKITAGGIVINGEDIYDETLGTTVKGTIKGLSNTTWNGTTTTPDRAATEGQLQTVSDKADEAVTEAGKHTIVSTKDENLGVENVGANGAAANYEISLKDKVVLGEGQGAIILNGQNKDEALLNVGNKLVIDQDGTTTIVANDGIDNRPGQTQITPDTTVTIAPSGVTFTGDDKGTTIIEGQKITAGGIVINGEDVYDKTTGIVTKGTITGLSNTTWDGTTDNESRVATEGQLEDLSDTVNTGWYVADKNTAEDSTTGNFAVKPGETLTFNGDDNIDVEAKDHEVNVSLNDNITLGEGNSQININGNPENGEAALSIGDKFVVEQNGTTTIVANDGIDNRPGQTQITPDTTVTIAPSGVTFTGDDKGTTIIEGQKITAGGIVINGEDVYDKTTGIVTKGTITGLSNTTWDGTTDNESRVATEGQLEDLSDTVNTGWYVADKNTAEDSTTGNFAVKPGETLTFNGDDNIDVEAKDHEVNVSLNDNITLGEGNSQININGNPENGEAALSIGDKFVVEQNGTTTIVANDGIDNRPGQTQITPDTTVTIAPSGVTFTGDDKGTTIIEGQKITAGGIVINGEDVYDKTTGIVTKGTITGLSNTTWDGKTDNASRVATEGQLEDLSDTVNTGWIATDGTTEVNVNPANNTLKFAGDNNITVTADSENNAINVKLNPVVTLDGNESDNNKVVLDGNNGTINATNTVKYGKGQGPGRTITNEFTFDNKGATFTSTTEKGHHDPVESSTNINGGTITTDTVKGLDNTTWNENIAKAVAEDKELQGVAATQGQLQTVDSKVNAGWIATDSQNHEVKITPDNNKLNFAGDENVTVTAANNEIKVALDDDIALGEYLNNGAGVLIGGSSGTISATNSITVGEDQGLIIDGQKKEIQGLSNTTWNEKIANDAAVEGSTAASTAATQGQLQEVSKVANAGWTASDGTNSISVKPNETLNFVGDENLTVSADGTDKELKVALKDDITLKGDSSSIELTGTKGTIQVNQETAEGTNFTNINGNVVSIGYTNSEGIENAIVIDGGKGTITGLSNTTWDDELATQVANSEELQGTAATQGQLQQAVSAVATEAAKQHTTVSGDDNLTVKSSVNENGGTNYQVTLDDDITLGNPKAGNTEGERSFTINTTNPEGYVPESYKTGSGADFIEENGGFMLFATDTQGHGIFGVTAKGSAWGKDFKTYTTDIYGNNTQYSLNEIGDAVAQMSSYYNGENGKSYTVFSRYLNEAEKDNPFVTVDEDGNEINATRDIPLALRDDGAVLIGATIKGDDFTDNGIRINAETDADGNNKATITGLENTEWKPPTPVATFAANDINTTSRAATESQLNDLYSAVAAYDVNVDGTIDYSHIALAGAPYGASRAGNGTPTGGTSITNVAYASGKDGSEAVNVDYLKDAISDAAENGSISTSDQHLVANTETGSNGVYKPDDNGNVNLIVSDEKGNSNTITIGDVASKSDVGDLNYSNAVGTEIADGDTVTDAIGKLDNRIDSITDTATNADKATVTGGNIKDDGTVSLTQKDGTTIDLDGKLADSGVVQEGTTFDKETGTLTITSQDKYSGETSSVKVEGIASTEVVGATTKEDLATAYKDADKDGNATTEYITDSESMVEADVALDHAIQDVAGTSYANDMVLSNRIDSVEKRLGNVEERIDKVGAMAAAIANLRTMGFDPEAPTEIAIGVGQYKSETGIAIGVFHYPNQDFMLSASLSSSGDELMGGIGATWKLGRKSAAERAKDEEARHLEQAEEMKKLAQQEKVKAQAQRHAKLLAERQQASQKNA